MELNYPEGQEIKENKLIGMPKVLTARQDRTIAKQQANSLCQITNKNIKASGFLCRIPNVQNPVLITNNHVLNKTDIKPGKKIDIYFTDENDDKH